MPAGPGAFDLVKGTNYLKTKYGTAGKITYNINYPIMGMVPKKTDMNAQYFEEPYELSLGAGGGFGSTKPEASNEKVERIRLETKNPMIRARIDRKAMKLMTGNETAFIDAMKHKIQRTQQALPLMLEIVYSGPADGSLGTIDALVTNTDPTFVVSITAATWNQYRWHIGWKFNIGSGTDVFELTAVDPANKRLTLSRPYGSQIPATTNKIFFQNAAGEIPLPIAAISDASLGDSLYNITAQFGWMPYQLLSVGQVIDEEILDDISLNTEARSGQALTKYLTSIKQWRMLKSGENGLKRYNVPNVNVPSQYKAMFGFTALEYISPALTRSVPILYSRFWADDRLTAMSDNCRIRQTHEPEWFDEDGTAFLRTPDNKTEYEATWGNYQQAWWPPQEIAVVTGLS